jgi:hypothetical protein
MNLPDLFCWTRIGTEAGQSIDKIMARKEEERFANNGLFFWGIGNAIGPSMLELVKRVDVPEVLFSPIRSTARREDVHPASVVAWTEGETLSGEKYELPAQSLVSSRFDPVSPRGRHYALVCCSDSPIALDLGKNKIQFSDLRNLLTGRPVGASQVTAVVSSTETKGDKGPSYDVAFRARLAPPYFICLRKPIPVFLPHENPSWSDAVNQVWRKGQRASGD